MVQGRGQPNRWRPKKQFGNSSPFSQLTEHSIIPRHGVGQLAFERRKIQIHDLDPLDYEEHNVNITLSPGKSDGSRSMDPLGRGMCEGWSLEIGMAFHGSVVRRDRSGE